MGELITLCVREDDADRRLDRVLRKALPELPLSALHRMLRRKLVLTDGRPAGPAEKLRAGTLITLPVYAPHIRAGAAERETGGPLVVLFEGLGLLVLNKPPGLAVHGEGDTLERRARAYLAERLPPSLSFRPGPLHRLDKPVSGAIVFATRRDAAAAFSAMLREGTIRKRYLAILEGRLTTGAVWKDTLVRDSAKRITQVTADCGLENGKSALTRVFPLRHAGTNRTALTLAALETGSGRTHQIRAQAAGHGHPLWGDVKYGSRPVHRKGGFFLHAAEIELPSAWPDDAPRVFSAPFPEAFAVLSRKLFSFEMDAIPKTGVLD
jgi:23S rRNA pseudouridine955/2504/2580 synthase